MKHRHMKTVIHLLSLMTALGLAPGFEPVANAQDNLEIYTDSLVNGFQDCSLLIAPRFDTAYLLSGPRLVNTNGLAQRRDQKQCCAIPRIGVVNVVCFENLTLEIVVCFNPSLAESRTHDGGIKCPLDGIAQFHPIFVA